MSVEYIDDGIDSRFTEIMNAMINGEEYNKPAQSRMEALLLDLKEVIDEGGGGVNNTDIIVLSAISSPKQESSTYAPSKAVECLSTSRWSSGANQLTYLEMTPYGGSACANAVYTYMRDATASDDTPMDCQVKIQGYDGSSWVDIETLSYLSTEIKAPVIKKFSNTTSYSKYRFNFQDYPYHNLSNTKFCGMMFIALLSV